MKNYFRGLSMQKKMTMSFAIPIIVIYILFNSYCYKYLTVKYEEKIRYSMEQSSAQANSFLANYAQAMAYLSNMVGKSADVQSILSDNSFNVNGSIANQYRDFIKIKNSLAWYEINNPMYRISIYIPDEFVYSPNHYTFFEESILEARVDYESLQKALATGSNYFAITQEKRSVDAKKEVVSLTLFSQIFSGDALPRPLNICSISIDLERIITVMKNANVTKDGILYVIDQNNQVLCASNADQLLSLKAMDGFPLKGEESAWDLIKLNNQAYYMIRKNVESVDWQMISLIPVKEYKRQYLFIQVIQMVTILIIAIFVYFVAHYLAKNYVGRLSKLRQKMNSLQEGDLNVHLPLDESRAQGDEIEDVYRNFNFMVSEVRRLMQEHYRLGKNVKVSELRALQAQINPHFLYNTLDLINWMALDYGASDIETLVWNLSRFYRLSLNHGKSIISIMEELEHVQVYVNIENIHFDHAITFEIQAPDELKELACLNIIIQPFVENAIVHGIAEVPEITSCAIHVTVEKDGEDILFHIQDDGPGMSEFQIYQLENLNLKQDSKGYGVKNINFRLKLCFGENYGVTYEHNLVTGTIAHIRIPALSISEAEEKMI